MQSLKENSKFERKLTCACKNNMRNFVNFILESKMLELNQDKNSKQPDRPGAVWKLYFTVEINE